MLPPSGLFNSVRRLVGEGKDVPLHAMKAPGGKGGIAPTHCQPRH
jgi:hypothetical protein